MMPISVSANQRFLNRAGEAFFWLGDTAWDLFRHTTLEQSAHYLNTRVKQGYNVVQAVLVSEFESRQNSGNLEGQPSLHDWNPATPNEAYFAHVDKVLAQAAAAGCYVALLPTWGDKVGPQHPSPGPVVFTLENARTYAEFLAKRYKHLPHIIWMIGGDRTPRSREQFLIWRTIATTLHENGAVQLTTFHPQGETSSSFTMHSELWLELNTIQSGHTMRHNPLAYQLIETDLVRLPQKPVLNAEPCYEDHPVNWRRENGMFDDLEVRKAAYWSVFAGACGHTYGHYSVFMFHSQAQPGAWADPQMLDWQEALHRPGAVQMQYLKQLWHTQRLYELEPTMALCENPEVRGMANLERAVLYVLPEVEQLEVRFNSSRAWWFDPRDGSSLEASRFEKPKGWADAVLIVEA